MRDVEMATSRNCERLPKIAFVELLLVCDPVWWPPNVPMGSKATKRKSNHFRNVFFWFHYNGAQSSVSSDRLSVPVKTLSPISLSIVTAAKTPSMWFHCS